MRNGCVRVGLFVGIMILGVTGCGKKEVVPTTPQASVKGTITFAGKAIPMDSSVVFFCSEEGATAAGKTDSLGKFQLVGATKAAGIPAGRYKVMIRPPEAEVKSISGGDYTEMMKKKSTTTAPEPPKDIPVKLMSLETSKLVLEVQSGDNSFEIDLSKFSD